MTVHQGFAERARSALGQPQVTATIRRVTMRVLEAREAGLARLPDADHYRDHARRIRAHTLARLDHYLDQFATGVESHGGHVYYAATADDAVAYIRELARSRGLTRAVKSKSMISEEIELNRHLAQAGIRVVETDLGEWIVQLAEDHPSHIVLPIIHKSRDDVAEVLRRVLGAGDADVTDVPSMTRFARRTLREEFLSADLGISGVNFGVAETGSLSISTNEGNGRLTTTLPKVHVALMGIERIVPTAGDLAVMLEVLARSATGQNITVYTNVLTGPRRPGESDGPEELHVVLLDNGRSRVLASEDAEVLYCIRCGACLNACPVYQQVGGHAYGSVYPGPVGAVLTPALRGLAEFHDLPDASSLCGACREVCPVRIDIPRMLLHLRREAAAHGHAPRWVSAGLRALRTAGTRPWLFRLATRLAGRATRRAATNGWISRLPGPLSGWTQSRDFPAFARESFHDWWARRRAS